MYTVFNQIKSVLYNAFTDNLNYLATIEYNTMSVTIC